MKNYFWIIFLPLLCVVLIFSCKKEESVELPPCENPLEEATFSIKLRKGSTEPLYIFPKFAILSDNDGNVLDFIELLEYEQNLETYCEGANSYNVTLLRFNYDQDSQKSNYSLMTYLDVPNGMLFNFKSLVNFGQTFKTDLEITNIESLQKIGTDFGLSVNPGEQVSPNSFLVKNFSAPYGSLYLKVWANGNSNPRFKLLEYVSRSLVLDYQEMTLTQDTVQVELFDNRFWRFQIRGVFDDYNLFNMVNLHSDPGLQERKRRLDFFLPIDHLDGYLVEISGTEEGKPNFRFTMRKYLEEIPQSINRRDFDVSILSRNHEELIIDTIEEASVVYTDWLLYNDDEKYVRWQVVGPANRFAFKAPAIPNKILEQYQGLDDVNSWGLQKNVHLYFYDRIETYEEYLESIYDGNLTNLTSFYNGEERYTGEYD
ncbi:MAG: hypothetical protein DHS20C18_35400 [Saprospiraceae bacterium]|nr:MAG: hypothetical protein DHS20C18_35400 [Saprospiraceae bacterium]